MSDRPPRRRSRISLDELRTAFQTAEAEAPGPVCPDPSLLFEAALGVLSPEAVAEVVDHVGHCPACAEGWRSAKATPAGVIGRTRGPC